MQNVLKRRLIRGFVGLLIGYMMITMALYFFQEKILFQPTTIEADYTFQFETSFEELFLKTDANALINALHFKVEKPKGVILYFHGNAGDLIRWGSIAEYFTNYQYNVFIIDYRTYGKSTGTLSEKAFYKDAQFAYDYLLKYYKEDEIMVYGRSLGTGIASYIASKNKPKQLVLETPYYNILDVAKSRFPVLPVKQLLKYHFPTNEFLPNVTCPITIFHGTDDAIVPYDSGRKLLDVNSNINFITIENGKHNNLVEFNSYQTQIKALLN